MKVNHKHLTYEQRLEIQSAIHSGFSKTQMSKITGKHITTIAREISIHRRLKYKCKMKLECSNYKTCKHGRVCHINCPDYIEFKCKRRDKSPGACNGCDS